VVDGGWLASGGKWQASSIPQAAGGQWAVIKVNDEKNFNFSFMFQK